MRTLKNLVGFETVVTLFLFSYQFKHLPFFHPFPDLTILLALLMIFWGGILLFKEKRVKLLKSVKPLWIFLIFWGWLGVSLLWAPQTSYVLSKALVFSIFTGPAFLGAAYIIGFQEERLHRLLLNMEIFSLAVLMQVILLYFTRTHLGELDWVWGNNYLVTGQTLGVGLGIIYAMALLQQEKCNKLLTPSFLAVASLFAFGLLQLGGRGPVLSAFLAVIAITFCFPWKNQKWFDRLLLFISFCLITLVFVFTFQSMSILEESRFLHRFLETYNFHSQTFDQSTLERWEGYRSAIKAFLTYPLKGVGIGGWPYFHGLGDKHWHPHNIFLEILSELGLVGFSLAGVFVGMFIHQGWRTLKQKEFSSNLVCLCGLLLFSFFNSLKSGDLNDNILLFMVLGLSLGAFGRESANFSTKISS